MTFWLPWATPVSLICSCLRPTLYWSIENRYRACIVQEVTILFRIPYFVPTLSFWFVFYLRQVENSKWFANKHVGWPKAASQGSGVSPQCCFPGFWSPRKVGSIFLFLFLLHSRVCSSIMKSIYLLYIISLFLNKKNKSWEGCLYVCYVWSTCKYISQHLEPLARNQPSSLNKTCLIRCTWQSLFSVHI